MKIKKALETDANNATIKRKVQSVEVKGLQWEQRRSCQAIVETKYRFVASQLSNIADITNILKAV